MINLPWVGPRGRATLSGGVSASSYSYGPTKGRLLATRGVVPRHSHTLTHTQHTRTQRVRSQAVEPHLPSKQKACRLAFVEVAVVAFVDAQVDAARVKPSGATPRPHATHTHTLTPNHTSSHGSSLNISPGLTNVFRVTASLNCSRCAVSLATLRDAHADLFGHQCGARLGRPGRFDGRAGESGERAAPRGPGHDGGNNGRQRRPAPPYEPHITHP